MTANVQTVRLKPNPSGKDRSRYGGASATQLGAEWADIKNVSNGPVNLTGVRLYHIAYSAIAGEGRWDEVIRLNGVLGAGMVIRVHSGSGPETVLRDEDRRGADYHFFTGRDNYVWNNDKGDSAALWLDGEKTWFDRASYDPDPPEGLVLERVGDRLVARAAYAGRRW